MIFFRPILKSFSLWATPIVSWEKNIVFSWNRNIFSEEEDKIVVQYLKVSHCGQLPLLGWRLCLTWISPIIFPSLDHILHNFLALLFMGFWICPINLLSPTHIWWHIYLTHKSTILFFHYSTFRICPIIRPLLTKERFSFLFLIISYFGFVQLLCYRIFYRNTFCLLFV